MKIGEYSVWSTMVFTTAPLLPSDTFIAADGQVLRIPKSGGNARDRRRARRAWLRAQR